MGEASETAPQHRRRRRGTSSNIGSGTDSDDGGGGQPLAIKKDNRSNGGHPPPPPLSPPRRRRPRNKRAAVGGGTTALKKVLQVGVGTVFLLWLASLVVSYSGLPLLPLLTPRREEGRGTAAAVVITLPLPISSSLRDGVARPDRLDGSRRAAKRNYGGLDLYSITHRYDGFRRRIPDNDAQIYHEEYKKYTKAMNKEAGTGMLTRREPHRLVHYDELPVPLENGCYRPKWSYAVYPTCNTFHEFTPFFDRPVGDDQAFDYMYLGRGTFRSWLMKDTHWDAEYVLKTNRYVEDREFGDYAMSQAQLEAIAMLVAAGSNRSMDVYSFCSTSILVERGYPFTETIIKDQNYRYMSQSSVESMQKHDVVPLNDYSPQEKLRISLAMAESLAVIHGNPKGVIAHHDLSFDQWLKDKDGIIKLNDYNKARLVPWNPEEHRYCTFYSSQESSYRAPEEIEGGGADESADVYTFGKIIYTILTGLVPHYQIREHEASYEAIIKGEAPIVDARYRTRSTIEGRLVEIMEKCWKKEMSERATIFDVVEHLRATARLANVSKEYLAAA